MSSNPLTMGYGGGDLLLTGAVWLTVGSLPRSVCAGCEQWPVWPAAPVSDESTLEVAWPPDRRLDRRPSAYTTMHYTNRQPLPFYLYWYHCCWCTSTEYWSSNVESSCNGNKATCSMMSMIIVTRQVGTSLLRKKHTRCCQFTHN